MIVVHILCMYSVTVATIVMELGAVDPEGTAELGIAVTFVNNNNEIGYWQVLKSNCFTAELLLFCMVCSINLRVLEIAGLIFLTTAQRRMHFFFTLMIRFVFLQLITTLVVRT